LRGEGELGASDSESDVGHQRDQLAADNSLSIDNGDSSDFLVDLLDLGGGTSNEACSGISNSSATSGSAEAERGGSDGNVVNRELPVGLAGEFDESWGSSVFGRISSAQLQLTSVSAVGVSVEPEREHLLGNQVLSDDVVPGGNDIINRDGLEGHTQNSVELSGDERDTWETSGLSENLVGDGESTELEGVLAEETSHRSTSVGDVELLSIGHVCGGAGRVVLVVDVACDHCDGALGGRNPQVGGSSVEDNHEGLGRSTKRNGSIVLGIHVVANRDGSKSTKLAIFHG